MSYVSALLWFLLLALSSAEAVSEAVREPVYFPQAHRLFPDWPVWQPKWALTLLATTAVILFLPKLLALVLIAVRQRRSRDFGGPVRLAASVAGEVLVSSLLAPIRMLFHSKFVFLTLLGRTAGWGSQQRDDRPTSWAEALRFHGGGTLLGAAWGWVLYQANPPFFWWNIPIVASLVLAAPLSVLTSRPGLGRLARRLGLFLIPQELDPPRELGWLAEALQRNEDAPPRPPGFVRAVVDPRVHRLHLALLGPPRSLTAGIVWRRQELVDKALHHGPGGLKAREKKEILYDPRSLAELHRQVWETDDPDVARAWGLPA
jgi:membrane glycosyltransferase